MPLGKLVFKDGVEGSYFDPETGEIDLTAGKRPTKEMLRHERSHAVYHVLPEATKQSLLDTFEREIGCETYMNSGRTIHPASYYMYPEELGGGVCKGLVVNEFIAVLASHPSHLLDDVNGFNYAPQFRQILIDNGFYTVNRTLRNLNLGGVSYV